MKVTPPTTMRGAASPMTLEKDNIVPEKGLCIEDLGIKPSSIYSISEDYLKRYITRY